MDITQREAALLLALYVTAGVVSGLVVDRIQRGAWAWERRR